MIGTSVAVSNKVFFGISFFRDSAVQNRVRLRPHGLTRREVDVMLNKVHGSGSFGEQA